MLACARNVQWPLDQRRRSFLQLVVGATVAWSVPAFGQQTAKLRIGYIDSTSPETAAKFVAGLREGFKTKGFAEDKNLEIEYRWARGEYAKLQSLAADLVARDVAAIVAATLPAANAAKAVTSRIPVIFVISADPVEFGLVPNLNRPGGNLTGLTQVLGQLGGKRLQLLHDMMPEAIKVGVLLNQTNPHSQAHTLNVQAAASRINLQAVLFKAATVAELDANFSAMKEQGIRAAIITDDPFFRMASSKLLAFESEQQLAIMHFDHSFVEAGGLISYGPDLPNLYREAGKYTGRVLNGEKPSDLPVIQPDKFYFAINARTARDRGLKVPLLLSAAADQVLE